MVATATAARDVERVGPFTATFARGIANPFLSFAIPDVNAEPTASDIDALTRAYRARDRTPRLEFIPALAPAVEPGLTRAGYAAEARVPLMIYDGAAVPPQQEGVELIDAMSVDDVRAAATAQHEAYGESERPTDGWIVGQMRAIGSGAVLLLARDLATGEPVGGGICTPPVAGASELAAIGVRSAYRRRGVAAAMTDRLARTIGARGANCIYLTAAGEAEARI
jgi:GNAT superfamily N-acetyltransferase